MLDFIENNYLSKYLISNEILVLIFAFFVFSFLIPKLRAIVVSILGINLFIFTEMMLNHFGVITLKDSLIEGYKAYVNTGRSILEILSITPQALNFDLFGKIDFIINIYNIFVALKTELYILPNLCVLPNILSIVFLPILIEIKNVVKEVKKVFINIKNCPILTSNTILRC